MELTKNGFAIAIRTFAIAKLKETYLPDGKIKSPKVLVRELEEEIEELRKKL